MDYLEAFDAIPVPATLVDADGIIVDINQAFFEYTRSRGRIVAKEDRVGRHVADFALEPETGARFREHVEQVLASGEPRDQLEASQAADGRPRLTWVKARAILRDGEVAGAVILREDRTDAMLQDWRRGLTQRLREEVWAMVDAGDVERLLIAVRDGLRQFGLPFGDCGVNVVDPELSMVRFHNMTSVGTWTEAFTETGVNLVLDFWRAGQVVYRRDLQREDPYGEAEEVRDLFGSVVRCIIDVPFSRGTLALNSERAEAFTDADIELLTEMAQVLSEGFDRMADLEALRRSEERYRTAVGQIADAILLVDHDQQCIVETNEACQRLLGYAEQELVGRPILDIVAHDADSVAANGELALRLGQSVLGERQYRHRDGHLIDVEVSLSRIEAGGGRVLCAVARNISERKAAERRRAGLQRLREEVWRMQTGQDIGGVLDVARQCLATTGVEFDHFGINVVRPAHPNPVQIFTRDTRPMEQPGSSERAIGTIVEWWRGGVPVHRPDLLAHDPYNEAAVLRSVYGAPVRSILDVPFSHGTVAINSHEAHAFDDADVACLQELAEALSDGFRRTDDLARLAAQREYLSVTLRSIGDGVIATDEKGQVQLLNDAAERLTGWTQAEAEGRDLHEIFQIVHEDTRQPCANPVDQVMQEGQAGGLPQQTLLIARDGTERLLADSAAPIRGGDGDIIGVVLVFQDVSEQRQAERVRERAARLESVGILAGGIAHDFNNILTGITGNLSLARFEARGDPRLDELLASAESASQRASQLTGQLLTFARGGAPARRSIDLADAAREAADFALRGSNVAVDYRMPEDLWPVHADLNQIGQVVQNLVINADQAMPEGGRLYIEAANVDVAPGAVPALPRGRYVRLRLRDQGTGIEAQVRERIFEPYFTTKESGSGLGLATVYAIVHQHDGHIDLETMPGAGTTFTIHLPAASTPPRVETGPQEGLARGQGQRILAMDDEESVLRLLERGLTRLGYAVETASAGDAAVRACDSALARGEPFAAVILDLTVPGGMGGVQALAALRQRAPELPAIVSSGYSNDPIVADPAAHGFQAMLPKPYRLRDLARVLREVLVA